MIGGENMTFLEDEKKLLIKSFTYILKEANGKGPKNIYIKYFADEIHIVIEGVVSHFEKYLIKHFGEEAIEILKDFYNRGSLITEKELTSLLNHRYIFAFYALESDFINDIFVYKMKIK